MYIYIMHRTQIYLSEQEKAVLEELSRQLGRTRSDLIRAAVQQVYLGAHQLDVVLSNLDASAGSWRRRTSGEQLVEELRRGRLSRLHADHRADQR